MISIPFCPKKQKQKMTSIPKRHDGGDKRDTRDGIEVWEMR